MQVVVVEVGRGGRAMGILPLTISFHSTFFQALPTRHRGLRAQSISVYHEHITIKNHEI